MEIVVKGRNSEISERFREHVVEKLLRLEKYDTRQKIHRVEVEVTHEKNPAPADRAARVEMTLRSRGPAVRAEAASTDQHSALDAAIDKLESRLRAPSTAAASTTVSMRRRRCHRRRRRCPTASHLPRPNPTTTSVQESRRTHATSRATAPSSCARRRTRRPPMTLDQAMYEMELVGHDFYLFLEKDSMRPSVVYLRRAYDYGVIHLDVTE